MREAIPLATLAGQGREVATLHNNLGVELWTFEGPQAALTELATGVAYATARGLTEIGDWTTTSTLSPLFDAGLLDEALETASILVEHLDANPATLAEVRSVQARIHALRGEPARAADYLAWLETTSRDSGDAEGLVFGLGSAAVTHAALTNPTHAATLLTELAAAQDTRDNPQYAALLPALIRTALAIDNLNIAHGLTTGYQPRTPYAHHALITATAALAEAGVDLQAAADGYADAAERWEQFGVVPEHASRCSDTAAASSTSGNPTTLPRSSNTPANFSPDSEPHRHSPRPTPCSDKPPRSALDGTTAAPVNGEGQSRTADTAIFRFRGRLRLVSADLEKPGLPAVSRALGFGGSRWVWVTPE